MNVCLVSQQYPPDTLRGGIGVQTWNKARSLARLGHTPHVLTCAADPAADLQTKDEAGVIVHRMQQPGFEFPVCETPTYWVGYAWSVLRQLHRLTRTTAFDGIYVGGSPFSVGPSSDVDNPVLTREDVSDVPAVFVADPFMLRSNDAWHMFFEVMNWRSGKGEIGLAISTDGTRWTYRQIVLAEAFHLSYPYVFEWAGAHYMIPESYQAGAVRLYRAQRFPMEWEFVGDLLANSYFVDASVARFRDRWWLFTETEPQRIKHDTLQLYHAEDLFGPWHEHPGSPIVRGDPRIARPAGRVLVLGDRMVRYAQSCYPTYGTEVRAFEVIQLTTTGYHEREVGPSPILRPSGTGWNASGMHHIDAHLVSDGQWMACVDGWYGR